MSLDTIPTRHTAGDSFEAYVDPRGFAPGQGAALKLVLIGPQRISLEGQPDGAGRWRCLQADTAAWPPGRYQLHAVYSQAAQRLSVQLGSVTVQPDPLSDSTNARSLLSRAERVLQDLQAAYDAYATSGRLHLEEYRVGDHFMKFRSISELLSALHAARRDVEAERSAARLAQGLSDRRRYVTRM